MPRLGCLLCNSRRRYYKKIVLPLLMKRATFIKTYIGLEHSKNSYKASFPCGTDITSCPYTTHSSPFVNESMSY